jgi:hypothetical protein
LQPVGDRFSVFAALLRLESKADLRRFSVRINPKSNNLFTNALMEGKSKHQIA